MTQIKTLADEIRNTMANTGTNQKKEKKEKAVKSSLMLEQIREYDNTKNKNMVHVRFDADTVKMLNCLKMAANIDVTKLVAFAVRTFFEQNPELKTMIKQYFQNTQL